MLRTRLLSLARGDVFAWLSSTRSSIHTSGCQLAKKKTESTTTTSPSTPTTDKKVTSNKSSTESYLSGEVFFGHNPYSFYDIENDMAKDRIVQPSSKPAKSSSS